MQLREIASIYVITSVSAEKDSLYSTVWATHRDPMIGFLLFDG